MPTGTTRSSMEEFDKALVEPAHAFFRVIDANGDNQLSLAEVQRAEQILADQIQRLRVPEPSNSLSHQIQRGNSTGTSRPRLDPLAGTTNTPGTAAPAPR